MRDKLLELLEARQLTRAAAAEILGKHPCTVRKWAAGIEPTPPWAVELLDYKTSERAKQ